MATADFARSAPNSQFVSIGKAAELLGCSTASLRLWESEGRISSYRMFGGGHRRYLLTELQKQVFGDVVESSTEKKVALYARCSHVSQRENLRRQRERLLAAVTEREECDASALKVYSEIASSFGNRPQLNKLVDDICDAKVSRIYVEHGDRLSRVASLTRLVEHLCRKHHVQIIALDVEEQDQDQMKSDLKELVEFVHVISCRTIARRVAERRRKKLSPETVQFLKERISEGWGLKDVTRLLNQSGFKTEDGKKISYRVVHNYSKTLKLLPTERHPKTGKRTNVGAEGHTFAEFVSEHLVKRKGSRCQSAAIYEGYLAWSRKKGINPLVRRKCSEWLTANNYGREIKCGYCWYVNVDLKGYDNVLKGKGKNRKGHKQKG